jgi:CDP-6-deoxy-D-xylo-4-hexulose-3-dehydrase
MQPEVTGRYCETGDKTNIVYLIDDVFWIGCFPGLTNEMSDFIVKTAIEFVVNVKAGLTLVK